MKQQEVRPLLQRVAAQIPKKQEAQELQNRTQEALLKLREVRPEALRKVHRQTKQLAAKQQLQVVAKQEVRPLLLRRAVAILKPSPREALQAVLRKAVLTQGVVRQEALQPEAKAAALKATKILVRIQIVPLREEVLQVEQEQGNNFQNTIWNVKALMTWCH